MILDGDQPSNRKHEHFVIAHPQRCTSRDSIASAEGIQIDPVPNRLNAVPWKFDLPGHLVRQSIGYREHTVDAPPHHSLHEQIAAPNFHGPVFTVDDPRDAGEPRCNDAFAQCSPAVRVDDVWTLAPEYTRELQYQPGIVAVSSREFEKWHLSPE